MDRIRIKGLEVWANHGVYPEENKLGQKFVFNIDMYMSTRKAGKTDDLDASVNYGDASALVKEFAQNNTFMLIERLVEGIAELLLKTYPIDKVDVEVEKPWAPVGLPLDTVAVKISRSWHRAFIAYGSNMGESEKTINEAIEKLSKSDGCKLGKVSTTIITAPYGVTDQPDFYNGAVELFTLLDPTELLDLLHKYEAEAHRERIIRWGPRTLDLDILFYDDLIMDSEELNIPHIEVALRDFVLKPMAEIAPGFVHPVYRKTMVDLLRELEQN